MEAKNNMVKCGVTDCAYHNECCCTASGITIGGKGAQNADATRCETFTPSGNAVNACDCSSKGGNTTIHCDVTNCAHNEGCCCMLDGIDVACSCTNCDCNTAEQTYCSSFHKYMY